MTRRSVWTPVPTSFSSYVKPSSATRMFSDHATSSVKAVLYAIAGLITCDCTSLLLRDKVGGVLDRFIMPQGLEILTFTVFSNPPTFAPPPWFGSEVTHEPAYEAAGLVLREAPQLM